MYSSAALTTFTMLGNYYHYLVLAIFVTPNRSLLWVEYPLPICSPHSPWQTLFISDSVDFTILDTSYKYNYTVIITQ